MLTLIKKQLKLLLYNYIRKQCKDEYENPTFARKNDRAVEFSYVFRNLSQIYPDEILDVGTGITALPHLMANCGFRVTAIDNIKDYWKNGMFNRHYYIIDDDITNSKVNKKFDLITCISVLEHIIDYNAAIRNIFKLLKDGGHLILTCPYTTNQYVDNVYQLPNSSYGRDLPFVCQSYSRKELNKWLIDNNVIIADQEYWQFWTGDFWTEGDQIIPPIKVKSHQKHQLSCMLIKK
jgi:SAM-dependent methyltransferase